MKAGADLEQARDTAAQGDPPGGRFCDAAQNLQKGALAGSVAADDAENLAFPDLKIDIPKRPEFLDLTSLEKLSTASGPDRHAREITDLLSDHIAQRRIPLVASASRLVLDNVTFGQIFGDDNRFRHSHVYRLNVSYTNSTNLRLKRSRACIARLWLIAY